MKPLTKKLNPSLNVYVSWFIAHALWFMVQVWFTVRGSWLIACMLQGSWLMAHPWHSPRGPKAQGSWIVTYPLWFRQSEGDGLTKPWPSEGDGLARLGIIGTTRPMTWVQQPWDPGSSATWSWPGQAMAMNHEQ